MVSVNSMLMLGICFLIKQDHAEMREGFRSISHLRFTLKHKHLNSLTQMLNGRKQQGTGIKFYKGGVAVHIFIL